MERVQSKSPFVCLNAELTLQTFSGQQARRKFIRHPRKSQIFLQNCLLTFSMFAALFLPASAFAQSGSASGPTDGPIINGRKADPQTNTPAIPPVTDILHGQTVMYPQNDLGILVNTSPYPNRNIVQTNLVPLNTTNSVASQQSTVTLGEAGTFSGVYTANSIESSSASGRMFNNGNDVVVTISRGTSVRDPNGSGLLPTWVMYYWNPATGVRNSTTVNAGLYANASTIYTKATMGNFNGDLLSDALCLVMSDFGSYTLWGFNVFTANDPNQVDSLKAGPEYASDGTSDSTIPLPGSLVVGDFNGDGVDEIAMLMRDGQTVRVYKVDPTTLSISPENTFQLPKAIQPGTLATGRFVAPGTVNLAAAGQQPNDFNITVFNIANPAVQNPAIVETDSLAPTNSYYNAIPINGILAQSAPIISSYIPPPGQQNPPQPNPAAMDQLVLGIQYVPPHNDSGGYIWIGTFDTTSKFVLQGQTGAPDQSGCLVDMKVGNFNNTTTNPSDNSTQLVRSLQIAAFEVLGSGEAYCTPNFDHGYVHIQIFNIAVPSDIVGTPQAAPKDGAGDWLNQPVSDVIPDMGPYNNLQGVSLLTGDFQGRSLQLGSPLKITLQGQIQPTIVLGMPPMHIDFVNPTSVLTSRCSAGVSKDATGACELNLTYRPTAPSARRPFNATYQFEGQQGTTSNFKSTTSWASYAGVSVEGKLKVNLPSSTVDITAKAAFKYQYDHSVAHENGSYQGFGYTLSQSTGQSDFVFYTESNQNLFMYPVLGRTDPSNGQLYATFSVPSHVQHSSTDGANQDWYQPVQEPGNILSYPWSKTSLAQQYPNGTTEPSESSCQYTDTSTGTYINLWKTGSSAGSTTSSSDAFSASSSLSATYGEAFDLFGYGAVASVTGTVDAGATLTFNSLNVDSSSINSSQGVQVNRGSFNNLGPARYAFKSYIFGLTNVAVGNSLLTPSGTFEDFQLNPDATQQITGPLFLGFAANPLSYSGGASDVSCAANQPWWQAVYTKPDIALNHPQRVEWSKSSSIATLRTLPPASNSVATEPFYQMKGVWITQQRSQPDTSATGMSLQSATAGDVLTITTRVYNYSLVGTDTAYPGSQVHVRIYGQQVCTQNSQLCNPAFQIRGNGNGDGDIIISSIPGFNNNNQNGKPNWALASADFDTTPYSGMDLAFWVVAWLTDGNGNILSEMPSHGILGATTFAGRQFSYLTDVPMETYSNNVGLYRVNSPFFVQPKNPIGQSASAATAGVNLKAASLITAEALRGSVEKISLLPGSQKLPLDELAHVNVTFQNKEAASQDTAVTYYDGDPDAGGTLFDLQHVRALEAGSSLTRHIAYRPQSCGVHELYAMARVEGLPATVGKTKVMVEIDPAARLATLQSTLQGLPINPGVKQGLGYVLTYAQALLKKGQRERARATLKVFNQTVQTLDGWDASIFSDDVDKLLAQSQTMVDCANWQH